MKLGPIMMDLEGVQLSKEEETLLKHPLVGGIILFTRNYRPGAQLTELIQHIRGLRQDILIAVDQEGGRVQRFRSGFTRLPPPRKFGQYYEHNPQAAKIFAETAGWIMASEIRRFDIDLSFAPVLDLDYARSEVIGDRSFHADPYAVTELASAYVHGMNRAGMQAVGKHFPGHGFVRGDSHHMLPMDSRELSDIKKMDLLPFTKLIQQNVLAGVMAAHIVVKEVDKLPVGFSEIWLKQLLRKRHHYKGIIFSDCLSMRGASKIGNFPERAEAALSAGCDMILICNQRKGVLEILDKLKNYVIPMDLHDRLQTLRAKPMSEVIDFEHDPAWREGISMLESL